MQPTETSTNHLPTAATLGDLVCVLAVPSYMSTADFLQFVVPHQPNVLNMRMLR